jgi:uncharacterized membrane protein
MPRRRRGPLYPFLAGFAASCFVGLLATDLAYWRTADVMWSDFSTWLVTVGAVVGWAAIAVALIEAVVARSFHSWPTWTRAIGYIVALILATLDMLVHTRDAWASVMPWGIALSAATVLVLLLTSLTRPRIYDAARAGAVA